MPAPRREHDPLRLPRRDKMLRAFCRVEGDQDDAARAVGLADLAQQLVGLARAGGRDRDVADRRVGADRPVQHAGHARGVPLGEEGLVLGRRHGEAIDPCDAHGGE